MADTKRVKEAKPSAYTRTPVRQVPPPKKRRPVVPVGNADRQLAAPAPDPQSPNITGRYETDDDAFTLQINQAGRQLQCWLVDYKTKVLERIEGDLQSPDTFALNLQGAPDQIGRIVVDPLGQHLFELRTQKRLLRRVGTGPILSDSVFDVLPPGVRAVTKRRQFFPLLGADRTKLRIGLNGSVIAPLITAFLDAPDGTGVADIMARATAAEKIDDLVRKLYSTFDASDLLLADEEGQRILGDQTLTRDGDTRSLLHWLQTMTSIVEQERLGSFGEMEHLKQHFKLKPNSGGPHDYAATFTVVGASGDFGIGLGGFTGQLDIVKVKGPGTGPVGSFKLVMGSASAGASVGANFGFKTGGTATSPHDWRGKNFPGTFTIVDASARAAPIISGSKTGMFIQGDGEFPELIIDLSGTFQDFGLALGAEIGGSLGYIFKSLATFPKRVPGKHQFDSDYATERKLETQIHFKFGSALLTDDGRKLLRILCANELASFLSSGSELTINSHADRVDSEPRNLELSRLRAQNTLQAIRDILGASFQVPAARVTLRGLGEEGAKDAGDKDATQNPNRRKSEVALNSRLVLTLSSKP